MFASVRTHPSSRCLVKRGRNNLVTMFATRNEVYSEFVSEALDNFSERY